MFTEKLKALREQLKLTQKQMGKRLAMEQSTYSRNERNNNPKPEFLERIKRFLGVDLEPWLKDDADDADTSSAEAMRIVHLEENPSAKPKKKRKRDKREERTIVEVIYVLARSLRMKQKRDKKKRKQRKDLRGGVSKPISGRVRTNQRISSCAFYSFARALCPLRQFPESRLHIPVKSR